MIAVREQEQIEVLNTGDDQIVISQAHSHGEDDANIYIWPEHIDALIASLKAIKAEIEAKNAA